MYVYYCKGTKDEVGSDGHPQSSAFDCSEFDSVAFELKSAMIEEYGERQIDILESFGLEHIPMTKVAFLEYLKLHLKYVQSNLQDGTHEGAQLEEADFLKKAKAFYDKVNSVWSSYEPEVYFPGGSAESRDRGEATPIIAYCKGDEECPRFVYLKQSLMKEKC